MEDNSSLSLQRQTSIHDHMESLSDDKAYDLDPSSKLRFVCTSDTHNQTDRYNFQIPDGDVLLHAGDFSQVQKFRCFYREVLFKNFAQSLLDEYFC